MCFVVGINSIELRWIIVMMYKFMKISGLCLATSQSPEMKKVKYFSWKWLQLVLYNQCRYRRDFCVRANGDALAGQNICA